MQPGDWQASIQKEVQGLISLTFCSRWLHLWANKFSEPIL